MKRALTIATSVLACGTAMVLALPAAASAATPRDRVIDRAFVDCARGSMLQVDLEREWRKLEADVEIYASPRERWTMTWSQSGRVVHTVTRSANREGEVNAWRYLADRPGVIEVTARSASGETCRAKLRV